MKYIFTLITIFTFSFVDAQLKLTVEVTGTPSSVRMTGPWWNWDPNGGPVAVDNNDNTWTVTLDPTPTVNMEYLWVVDGIQEDLIADAAGGSCVTAIDSGNLITDYSGYANRVWVLNNPDIQTFYDNCSSLTFSTAADILEFVTLYPNPAKDIARISSAESVDLVRVFDLTGRIVKQASPSKANFSLDVADLSKGVYLVKLNAGKKETTTKLIK